VKLKAERYSQRMGSRISVMKDDERVAMLEVKILRQGTQTVEEASETVVTYVSSLQPATLLNEAFDLLFDIMLGDDGEAYFQAERFLKAHRPDLYDRIGQAKDLIAIAEDDAKHHAAGQQGDTE
jgi:hypothetical protein